MKRVHAVVHYKLHNYLRILEHTGIFFFFFFSFQIEEKNPCYVFMALLRYS